MRNIIFVHVGTSTYLLEIYKTHSKTIYIYQGYCNLAIYKQKHVRSICEKCNVTRFSSNIGRTWQFCNQK